MRGGLQRKFETETLTKEQTTISSVSATDDGTQLSIQWTAPVNGSRQSDFSTAWLRHHSYAHHHQQERVLADCATVIHWDARISGLEGVPKVSYGSLIGPPEDQLQFLRHMRRFGFAIVEGTPSADGSVLQLANTIGYVRRTNYGSSFTVRDSPDARYTHQA